jgi:hypothetical protein
MDTTIFEELTHDTLKIYPQIILYFQAFRKSQYFLNSRIFRDFKMWVDFENFIFWKVSNDQNSLKLFIILLLEIDVSIC